jgi:hypothetical protein
MFFRRTARLKICARTMSLIAQQSIERLERQAVLDGLERHLHHLPKHLQAIKHFASLTRGVLAPFDD